MIPYLQKLTNDVDESLWDLLLVHVWDEPNRIQKGSPNQQDFLKILRRAIDSLESNCEEKRRRPDFKPEFLRNQFRTILILANKILRYENDERIKALKKSIIEEYTGAPQSDEEIIPLRYQITELRITYDARYLAYLTELLLEKRIYDKALYCLLTLRLIEPDHPQLETWYETIHEALDEPALEPYEEPDLDNHLILLDANAAHPRIFHDIGSFRIFSHDAPDLSKLGNRNEFGLTPSVRAELKGIADYQISKAQKLSETNRRISYFEVRDELTTRLAKTFEKLGIDAEPADLDDIRAMYEEHLGALEAILERKLERRDLSHKLKKLSERDTLLPEDGDLRLLAEAISLSKTRKVAILTRDADFLEFQKPIRERFGIEVLSA